MAALPLFNPSADTTALHNRACCCNLSGSPLPATKADFFAPRKRRPSPPPPQPNHSHEPATHMVDRRDDNNMMRYPDLVPNFPAKRHQDYSLRLPTPPRIVVPPPAMGSDMPSLNVGSAVTNPGEEEYDTSFLKELNLEDIVRKNTVLEWAYERRRQAQMMLPWLYLGPLSAARDRQFLAQEGITMMLCVRTNATSMNGALQVGREMCNEVATIEVLQNDPLIRVFPHATRLINQHLAKIRHLTAATGNPQMGRVLVFCESGNDRSAAVVAAYLMDMMSNFDHIQSMQVCQSQRFCINFDDTIKNILAAYWDILQAKRSVAQSRTESLQAPVSNGFQQSFLHHQKRTRVNTAQDEDVEMDGGMDDDDMLRFGGRTNTPFMDS